MPADLRAAAPRRAEPLAAWEAVHAGAAIGVVVRFGRAGSPTETWFSVRNAHGQELGMIDRLGRAFRFRPEAQAQWLGSGTVAEGVARLLVPAGPLELVEVPLATLAREAARAAPSVPPAAGLQRPDPEAGRP